MFDGNIVYKTFDIDTNIEYTTGKKINLSGVRIIKLINRPAGVQVWISTDSNGTNLFPLINRGDGWELPDNFPPLYFLYIYTKGVNASDKLVLSYTGEKNFFSFGSNSIEKIGEIESFGESARLDINNSIFNYYSRIPYTPNDKVFSKAFTGEILFPNTGTLDTTRYVFFPLSPTGLISELQLNDSDFYRFSIEGHIDGMSDATATWLGSSSGNSSCVEVIHLSLFNNTQGANFEAVTGQEIENLYKLDKRPYLSTDKFDLFGLKSVSHGGGLFLSGINQIKQDIIMAGKAINKYQYFGIFFTFDTWSDSGFLLNPCLHCSLIFTISKAISYVDIIDTLPTEANRWIDFEAVSLKNFASDNKKTDYIIEQYKKIGVANKMMTEEENLEIPKTELIFNKLISIVTETESVEERGDNISISKDGAKTMLKQYALNLYDYYTAWQKIEYLLPTIKEEEELQRIEDSKQKIIEEGSSVTKFINDWHYGNNPVGLIDFLISIKINPWDES